MIPPLLPIDRRIRHWLAGVLLAVLGLWFWQHRLNPQVFPGSHIATIGDGGGINFAAFSADMRYAYVTETSPPKSSVVDLGKAKRLFELGGLALEAATAWSPAEPRLATSWLDGGCQVYDPIRGAKPRILCQGKGEDLWSLAWSPDGRRLALVAQSWIRIVEAATGKVVREWPAGLDRFPTPIVAWSPDANRLAVAASGRVALLDCLSGAEIRRFKVQDRNPERVAWSPNGRLVAVRQGRETGWPTYTSVYDVSRGVRVRRIRCWEQAVIAEWSPDGSLLLLGAGKISGYQGSPGLAIIDAKSGRHVARLGSPGPHWMGARWLGSSNTIYAVRSNGELWNWKLPSAIGNSQAATK